MYIKAELAEGDVAYRVFVYLEKPDTEEPVDVEEIVEGDDILSIVWKLEETYGSDLETAYIRTGDGDWEQPEFLTVAECIDASLM